MMDENRNSGLGLGGLGLPRSGSQQGSFSQLSPYLNVDPSMLHAQTPEFLVDQEMERGKLEKMFAAIGTSLGVGAVSGAVYGLFDGIRHTANSDLTGRLRRTQIINHTIKSGGSTANALGAVFFMYSTSYVLMGLTHEKAEEADNLRSCLAGGLTGALYKSSAGARKSLLGGAFGLTAAALWTFVIKRDNTVSNYV